MHPDIYTYAQRGWKLVPILPGTKRPRLNDWPRRASCDIPTVTQWWTDHPEDGVGIATGTVSGLWVLDIDPRNGGDETLHELEQQHEPIEGHYEVLTGGGGRHLYFTIVDDVAVHAGILGPGLDIKADGGQVLAPPTVHPDTGRPYTLELSGAETPRRAPAWLEQLVAASTRAAEKTEPIPREDLARSIFAWDRFNGAATNELTASFMEELGWRISDRKRGGAIHLTRPDLYDGEGKQGTSMTVGEIGGAPGVAFCWTSSVPGFVNERPYDAAEILAMARYGGDEQACDLELTAAGWGARSRWVDPDRETERYVAVAAHLAAFVTADQDDPWADVDVARVLTEPPVMPALLERTDGQPLLYPGSVHWVTAEPESGKTWLLLFAAAQVMNSGGHVTLLDYENGPLPLLERLLLLGVSRDRLIRQMHLKSMPPSWVDAQPRLLQEVQSTGSRLVGIDSCQSCMASAGLDPIDNYDVLKFYDFARRLAIGGAAVGVLDHLGKRDSATERYPLGAGQKLAQATVALGMQKRAQFGPGRTGIAALYLHKDRHGSLRKVADQVSSYDMIGSFELESDPLTGQCMALLKPYGQATAYVQSAPLVDLPYQVMQRVTDLLIDEGPLTQTYLEHRIDATTKEVQIAVAMLAKRGFIEIAESAPKTWRVLGHGYRANHDKDSPYYTGDDDE